MLTAPREARAAASATPPTEAEPPRMFLTAAEVAQELGLQKSRVYELAAGDLLPVVRLGRRLLFPRRGLEALAEAAIARTQAATAGDVASPSRWVR